MLRIYYIFGLIFLLFLLLSGTTIDVNYSNPLAAYLVTLMIMIPLWLRSSILVLLTIYLIIGYIKHIESNEHSVILSICTLFLFDVIISIGLSVVMLSYTVKGSFLVIHHTVPLEGLRWAYFYWVWRIQIRKKFGFIISNEDTVIFDWITWEAFFRSHPLYTHDMDASDIYREAINSANRFVSFTKFITYLKTLCRPETLLSLYFIYQDW